jgi:hypothetical protein
MQCAACGAKVPSSARFCPNCGEPLGSSPRSIQTGGGGYAGGNVRAGRDYVGRDSIGRDQNIGVSGDELEHLFEAVYRRIDEPLTQRKADPEEVRDTVQRVEREVEKGDRADTHHIERWLKTLADVAPDVLEVTVNALLAGPGAAVASAVRAVAKRFKDRQPSRG